MPVYNASRYLRQALESILAQTFPDFELLVFDDGSTDETIQILNGYAAKDPRVSVFEEGHRGITNCLMDGVARARGEYLARMDGDDVAHPERFRLQVAYLDRHPECVVVGADATYIDPEGWPIAPLAVKLSHEEIEGQLLQGHGHAIVHPVAMFRRQAIQLAGGYRQQYETAEDLDLFLRLAETGRLANLPEVLLQYRRHAKSISHAQHERQIATILSVLKEAYERRGLRARLPDRRPYPKGYNPEADHWIGWAVGAARAGNFATAAKYVFATLRHHPIQAVLFSMKAPVRWLRRRLGWPAAAK